MKELRIGRQGGWIGLVAILFALIIVAMLAKDALKQYALIPGADTATRAGSAEERARATVGSGIDAAEVGTVERAPSAPMDRARGLEASVKRQAEQRAARIDGAAR